MRPELNDQIREMAQAGSETGDQSFGNIGESRFFAATFELLSGSSRMN